MNIIRRFLKMETGLKVSEYVVVGAMIEFTVIGKFTDLANAIGSNIEDVCASGASDVASGLSTCVER